MRHAAADGVSARSMLKSSSAIGRRWPLTLVVASGVGHRGSDTAVRGHLTRGAFLVFQRLNA